MLDEEKDLSELNMDDLSGPSCSNCGTIMRQTGHCYTCPECGNNTGCS